ncbi:MAG TPA: type II toxin-antitoxin system VapC family toxin [Pyrinomonadaceae bacterium]|nr:type II toxin-antitoxin system VapC family toxin [Pyrinomonadaceae bacterium]
MADFFLDSSALVKRYIKETGTVFVAGLVEVSNGNTIFIAQITKVEVSSAFARRNKGKTLSDIDAAASLASFNIDLTDIYYAVDMTADHVASAADLATKHALRGYDAVQLATALAANYELIKNGDHSLVFVSADSELNTAAISEGLGVENPNDYP